MAKQKIFKKIDKNFHIKIEEKNQIFKREIICWKKTRLINKIFFDQILH